MTDVGSRLGFGAQEFCTISAWTLKGQQQLGDKLFFTVLSLSTSPVEPHL